MHIKVKSYNIYMHVSKHQQEQLNQKLCGIGTIQKIITHLKV